MCDISELLVMDIPSCCHHFVSCHVVWKVYYWHNFYLRCRLHCVQKKTHSHFLSYLHEWHVDLNKNCTDYTPGKVDSHDIDIRYSLRPMTSLWRHICVAKDGASLQHAISHEPRISFFCEYTHTCWCVDAVISCIMWWNLRQFNAKQLFVRKPDLFRSPLTRDNVTATECCRWLMQIPLGGYFEHKLWHFNSSMTK